MDSPRDEARPEEELSDLALLLWMIVLPLEVYAIIIIMLIIRAL